MGAGKDRLTGDHPRSQIMKQILQNLGNGETLLADVPFPALGKNSALIESRRSLVSLGTEKMLIDFGRGGWIAKARSQPDKVKQVFQKIKTDGLWTTIDAVKAKLDTPIPLGYCNVGVALEVSEDSPFQVGDRIASNGPHAETVSVSQNLAARIPDRVSDDQAAFTVVGAIGLQGIRLLNPTLGERIVVSGLGLIGLLSVQMLKANGCQVLGIDFDPAKLALARQFGAETCDLSLGQDPVLAAEQWTKGSGVDGVLITASTKSDELIHQAATMCRQRGRIVLVGVVGLNLQRSDFYEKELTFQVSCSYGPGRYDPQYEKRGLDYPIGFVRWTEQRNFEAVLQLMADGKIDVSPLITHRFSFDNALDAYQAINEPGAMGIVLEYGEQGVEGCRLEVDGGAVSRGVDEWVSGKDVGEDRDQRGQGKGQGDEFSAREPLTPNPSPRSGARGGEKIAGVKRDVGIAFVGAGGFTTRMLMPSLPANGLRRETVISNSGVSAAYAAKKFNFARTSASFHDVLADDRVDAFFITTPHHLHGRMVADALRAGKHVFVEKPLALALDEIDEIEQLANDRPSQCLMVGFNRRFSPHMTALREWGTAAPSNRAIIITVNAGAIPEKHWTQDPSIGGGRIVGEACHFVDLARYLAGSPIAKAEVFPILGGDGRLGDCVSIQMQFEDGSTASVHYLANGSKDFPKERVEVFAGGKVLVCDNFRVTTEVGGKRRLRTRAQDKGHRHEVERFLNAIRNGGQAPIPLSELLEVSRTAVALGRLSKRG